MKKLILSLAVITIATMTASAQVKFGGKAGLNLATFSGSDASALFDGKSMQAGANFGAIVQIPVSGRFSVNPELVFSMQGVKFDGGSWKLNYLNIPVMAHFATAGGFFVEAGPQIGFLMSAKEKDASGSTDIKEFLNSTDFALGLGAGFQSQSGFGGNARVNIGLSSIDKGTPKAKINNMVIQIGVFYMFNSKGGKE